MLISHLRKTRHHHDPDQTFPVSLTWYGPAVSEAARLREDQDTSVRGTFHDFDEVAAPGFAVVRTRRPGREYGAKSICSKGDIAIADREIRPVVFRTGTEIM
jgi:hypothetical protein